MKFFSLFALLFLGFLLSGCGSDSVEDVATKYVELASEGEISKLKEIVTPDNIEVRKIASGCSDETKKMWATIHKYIDKRGRFVGEAKKIRSAKSKEVLDKLLRNHSIPSPQVAANIGKATIEEVANGDKHLEKLLYLYAKGDGYGLGKYMRDFIYSKTDKVREYCTIPEIEDIKVININKSKEGDKATVKLEVVYKSGESSKYRMRLEEIKGEWKVRRGIGR